jgi:small subunit ribosomal protein S20
MPQRKSAKKELRKNVKKRKQNLMVKARMKITVKKFKKALKDKNTETAKGMLSSLYEHLDKAAAKKIIHPKTAARKKSRLTKDLHRSAQQ